MSGLPSDDRPRICEGVEINLREFNEDWADENRGFLRLLLRTPREQRDDEFDISEGIAAVIDERPYDAVGLVCAKRQRGVAGERPGIIRRPDDGKIEVSALVQCFDDCAGFDQIPDQHKVILKYKYKSRNCEEHLPQSAYSAYNNNDQKAACRQCQNGLHLQKKRTVDRRVSATQEMDDLNEYLEKMKLVVNELRIEKHNVQKKLLRRNNKIASLKEKLNTLLDAKLNPHNTAACPNNASDFLELSPSEQKKYMDLAEACLETLIDVAYPKEDYQITNHVQKQMVKRMIEAGTRGRNEDGNFQGRLNKKISSHMIEYCVGIAVKVGKDAYMKLAANSLGASWPSYSSIAKAISTVSLSSGFKSDAVSALVLQLNKMDEVRGHLLGPEENIPLRKHAYFALSCDGKEISRNVVYSPATKEVYGFIDRNIRQPLDVMIYRYE
jgi:hypothetical protein